MFSRLSFSKRSALMPYLAAFGVSLILYTTGWCFARGMLSDARWFTYAQAFVALTAYAFVLAHMFVRRHQLLGVFIFPWLMAISMFVNEDIVTRRIFNDSMLLFLSISAMVGAAQLMIGAALEAHHKWGRMHRAIEAVMDLVGVMFPIVVIFLSINRTPYSFNSLLLFYQTNYEEAIHYFFKILNGVVLLLLMIALFSSFIWCDWRLTHAPRFTKESFLNHTLLVVTLLTGIFFCFQCYEHNSSYVFKPLRDLADYRHQTRLYTQCRPIRIDNIERDAAAHDAKNGNDGVFVLLIGESLSRQYMSAYTYPKPTTPHMAELVDSGRMKRFDNAYSAGNQTLLAMHYMLTANSQYENKDASHKYCIFEVLNVLKYKTLWITAQVQSDFRESGFSMLTDDADIPVYLYSRFENTMAPAERDAAMIERILEVAAHAEPRTFIAAQFAGCHTPYTDKYPENFAARDDFNAYEKALCYNDALIGKLFNDPAFQNVDVLVYVSDHAEGPENLRRVMRFNVNVHTIPMFVYISERYARAHPELVTQLTKAQTKLFTNDLTYNLFLALMGIDNHSTPAHLNILSPQYRIDENSARIYSGRRRVPGSAQQRR